MSDPLDALVRPAAIASTSVARAALAAACRVVLSSQSLSRAGSRRRRASRRQRRHRQHQRGSRPHRSLRGRRLVRDHAGRALAREHSRCTMVPGHRRRRRSIERARSGGECRNVWSGDHSRSSTRPSSTISIAYASTPLPSSYHLDRRSAAHRHVEAGARRRAAGARVAARLCVVRRRDAVTRFCAG